MFSEELDKISWDDITARIQAKTDNDVRRALGKERCDLEDFMALISFFITKGSLRTGSIPWGSASTQSRQKNSLSLPLNSSSPWTAGQSGN